MNITAVSVMKGFLKRRRQRHCVARHLKEYGGFVFHGQAVDVPEYIGLGIQSIVADGSYEAAECDLIGRFLPADIPVIELGGCLGLVSSFIATRLAKETKHIVVEANPRLVDICWKNASLAGYRENTSIVGKAIAYGSSTVSFDISDNAHISKLSSRHEPAATLIAATRLSDLIELLEPPHRYVLICDIEGAEVDLLEHDLEALKACEMLIIELHPEAYQARGYTVDGVVELLRSTGLREMARTDNVYAFQK